MSNWYGAARSNYVRIKDMDALKAAIDGISITTQIDDDGRVAFFGDDNDSGGWPMIEDEDGNVEPIDWSAVVCPHLVEGEILVIMEVGFERLRYLTGEALAYNHEGRVHQVNLNQIYTQAAKAFNVPVGSISEAKY